MFGDRRHRGIFRFASRTRSIQNPAPRIRHLFTVYVILARPESLSFAHRYPLAVSSFFGLLHGFGFAAALREAGLPRSEIAAALLFFNAGVEVDQLVFIAVVLTLIWIVLACSRRAGFTAAHGAFARVEWLAAYGLGIPAAFWFIERMQALGFR